MIIFYGKQHALITFTLMYVMGNFNIYWLIGGIIGSYLPDCDHRYAPAGYVIPLHLFMGHRTYTHSYMFAFIFSCIGMIFNIWLGFGILFGYLLHLYADRFGTYTGITEGLQYLYWPYIKKKAA